MKTVYVIEWCNGNTDVFCSQSSAEACYSSDLEMLEIVRETGKEISIFDATPESSSCVWEKGLE